MPSLASDKPNAPLAERLRPKTIAEIVGQRHMLGDGKPLANAIKVGVPHSMIFWGPPGGRRERHSRSYRTGAAHA